MPNLTSNDLDVASSRYEYREIKDFFINGYEGGRDRIFSISSRLTDDIYASEDRNGRGGEFLFGTAWGFFEETYLLSDLFPCAGFHYSGDAETGERKSERRCGGRFISAQGMLAEMEKQVLRESRRTCIGTRGTGHTVRVENGVPTIWDELGYISGLEETPEPDSILEISLGNFHTVCLKKDGTVIAAGSNVNRQCNVSDLPEKAVSVSCGRYHTAILLESGKVVVAGEPDNEPGYIDEIIEKRNKKTLLLPYSISRHTDWREWPPMVKIKSVYDAVTGVTADGKLFVDGYCPYDTNTLKRLITEVPDPFSIDGLSGAVDEVLVKMKDPKLLETAVDLILGPYDPSSAVNGIEEYLLQNEWWKWSMRIVASGYNVKKKLEEHLIPEAEKAGIADGFCQSEWQNKGNSEKSVLEGINISNSCDPKMFLSFCSKMKQIEPSIEIKAEAFSAAQGFTITSSAAQLGIDFREKKKRKTVANT